VLDGSREGYQQLYKLSYQQFKATFNYMMWKIWFQEGKDLCLETWYTREDVNCWQVSL